jgi:S-adenosylmethionine:tRNA ribosyltransferase-isomerase
MLKTSDFDYKLPSELIAQRPIARRDSSRMLVIDRDTDRIEHRKTLNLADYLKPGDILVANDSRVIRARLFGRKEGTGGKVELLILERLGNRCWRAIVGGKRVKQGTLIRLYDNQGHETGVLAKISKVLDGALREVKFSEPISQILDKVGHIPLPPYIHEELSDNERYQTVYSHKEGSIAAPTAGLHFTPELLLSLRESGVLLEMVTLHVGLDTFKPVESESPSSHVIHSEWASLSPESARRINEARLAGGRLFAVGTTSVRVLESAALRSAGIHGSLAKISQTDLQGDTFDICPWRPVAAFEGYTDLFIYPGYRFRAVDGLMTNFHLPRSSLLMLVSAMAGRERILSAYNIAIREKYRFYSFGDATLII